MQGADLDPQDEVEDSAEGDEDPTRGGNFPGSVFIHLIYR